MKTQYLFLPAFKQYLSALAVSIAFVACAMAMPVAAHAATKASSADAEATIASSSLSVSTGKKASLKGTATDVSRIRVVVTSEDTDKTVFKSKILKVKKGAWKASVTKKLKDGQYTVSVLDYDDKKHPELVDETLTVGKSQAVLTASSIPLLGGGTANAGALVPVSYLQIRNTSKSTVDLKGFWVAQSGSAADGAVIGFSSVDDKGGSRASVGGFEGTAALSKGKAFIPSSATFAPGERKLFTLKAQLSSSVEKYLGSTLMLDVTGIEGNGTFNGAYPIRGTTWTIAR